MSDDREWIMRLFDEAMAEGDMPKMRSVMEVALHRLHSEYVTVGDRERRLSNAQKVLDGYREQLEWAWQYVPEEVLAEAAEKRKRYNDRIGSCIQAALDKREFDALVADFDKDQP